jgi:hypothetical protein
VLQRHFPSISPTLRMLFAIFNTFKTEPQVVWPLGGVLKHRWPHGSILRPRFCIGGPMEIFVYFLPFKSYSSVSIWLKIRHAGSKMWGFRGVFTPKCSFVSTQSPIMALFCSKPRYLSACKSVKSSDVQRLTRKRVKYKVR